MAAGRSACAYRYLEFQLAYLVRPGAVELLGAPQVKPVSIPSRRHATRLPCYPLVMRSAMLSQARTILILRADKGRILQQLIRGG